MIGFAIQIYQATHCFSNQLRAANSIPGYSASCMDVPDAAQVALNDMMVE